MKSLTLNLLAAVALLVAAIPNPAAAQDAKTQLAAKARDILQANCFECHGGKRKAAGIDILDHGKLISSETIIPGKPDDSLVSYLISGAEEPVMPPPPRDRLTADEVATIKAWIAAGAPDFPSPEETQDKGPTTFSGPIGSDYVLRSILQDVRKLSTANRRYARYFSIAHILNAGATKEVLEEHRDALAKAINHLSWKEKLVAPTPVEPTQTVFRIDLRDFGWEQQPFQQVKDGKVAGKASLDIYDLALLEYPYGIVEHKSAAYKAVVREFLNDALQIRPIPYVRADWFVSVVTQPPLYEEFLQLPRTLKELEDLLGVNGEENVKNFKVARAGVTQSGVSRNNRVVERHETKYGYYWKSYDFASSTQNENIFKDPINFNASGGEMIFTLPNGLQAYFITDAAGDRINEAPTSIVVDSFSSDKIVRNGLACMRCHDRGLKTFADDVRPAWENMTGQSAGDVDVQRILKLYPPQETMDKLVQGDEKRFMDAMEKLLGKPQTVEPLKKVSPRFLDERLTLAHTGAELGLAVSTKLKQTFQAPEFLQFGFAPLVAGGLVPRDAWDDSYNLVVRKMDLGIPLVRFDSLTTFNYVPDSPAPFQVELKTSKADNTFEPDEDMVIFIKPTKDVFIELIFTNAKGEKQILVPSNTTVKANTLVRFPPDGKELKAPKGKGAGKITLMACENRFKGGLLLRGNNMADRVVHRIRFLRGQQNLQLEYAPHPFKTVMKTITFVTR